MELKENKDKGVFVKDLHILTVKSIAEIEQVMERGNKLRMVGQTAMNDTSSRSHSIFTIYIETAETVSISKCLMNLMSDLPLFFLRCKASKDSKLVN